MAEEQFNKTPRKANRWFLAAIIFALLYGATFALDSFFNWIFFCISAYSFFMAYYLLPVQPKIFQQQRRQQNYGGQTQFNTGAGEPVTAVQKARRILLGIVGTVFGLFVIMVVYFMINPGPQDPAITYEENSEPTEEPIEEPAQSEVNYVEKGNDFFNDQQYDSADMYYDLALQQDAGNAEAVYGKGIVLWQHEKKDEARVVLQKAYDGGYRYYWLSWALAEMYSEQGRTADAIALYKESIGLDSTYNDNYNKLALLDPENRDQYLKLAEKHPAN